MNLNSIIIQLTQEESIRQENTLNLIASENYVYPEILSTLGSRLTNKYAEGYPNKRYYGGCSIVDKIETVAIEAAKKTFGAEHANVQPHSGSQANSAVYLAALKPGDTVIAMALPAGGHLTHGHKLNSSGILYNFIPYQLDPLTEQINYDELEKLIIEHKPKLVIAGGSAYPQEIDFEQIATIVHNNNSLFLADIAHLAGLIAAGLHQNPTSCADFVTSTTHKGLRGPRGGFILCKKEWAEKIDKAVFPGLQGGPSMNNIAAKAITFEQAATNSFANYQQQVLQNCKTMATEFKNLGYRLVAQGTATHLFLLDLQSSKDSSGQTMTGRQAETALESCNIVVNRNVIPFDKLSPLNPSGIRIGTAAITSRGLQETECKILVKLIDQALWCNNDKATLESVQQEIAQLCRQFPIPQ